MNIEHENMFMLGMLASCKKSFEGTSTVKSFQKLPPDFLVSELRLLFGKFSNKKINRKFRVTMVVGQLPGS
jgi:hypothetical protein